VNVSFTNIIINYCFFFCF